MSNVLQHLIEAIHRFLISIADVLFENSIRQTWLPAIACASTLSMAAPAVQKNELRINQLQVVTTHNSYHIETNFTEKALFEKLASGPTSYYYSHASPQDQLEYQSVRGFEFDVWADASGGRWSRPLIRQLLRGEMPQSPLMSQPGAKVFHVSDLDVRSTCYTIVECLEKVKEWSDGHPHHVPLPIMIEFKVASQEQVDIGGVQSEEWNTTNLDYLDKEIRSVFPDERIITPDSVRRAPLTLEQSVLKYGWPTLEESRGKVLFLMDNDANRTSNNIRNPYRAGGRDNLDGRVIFTNSYVGQPDCAFLKKNDPTGENIAEIQGLVQAGYFVRTRADEPLTTVLEGDTTMRDAAFASGAQLVTTDFPVVGMAARYGSDYVCQLPDRAVVRCNPVSAPRSCKSDDLE